MLTIKENKLNLRTYKYFYKGQINNLDDNYFKEAVKNYQKFNSLFVDGIIGTKTQNKILNDIKYIQNLLNKQGFNLKVDGICGTNTINAIKYFQMQNKILVDGIVGTNTLKLLKKPRKKYECKYFKYSEFTCKCGCGSNNVKDGVKKVCDMVREKFGKTIVSSGTRCENHNAKIGGVQGSYHISGNACDLICVNADAKEVLKYTKTLVKKRLLRYTYGGTKKMGNAVHVDTGGLE